MNSSTPRVRSFTLLRLSDQDIDDTTLGKLLAEAHREYADYLSPEGVSSVSRHCLSRPIERGHLWERAISIRLVLVSETRTITQAEKMVDRTGKPVGEISSSAQIRTFFDEQREMIISECCEKICHHELQAARAEQERQIGQPELCRQQKGFS